MRKSFYMMLILILILTAIPALAVAADPVDNPTSVGVNGGTLSISPGPISFSSVQISNGSSVVSSATSYLEVSDETGEGDGWEVRAAVSPFRTSNVVDPSSSGAGQFIVEIPATSLTINMTGVSLIAGQVVNATYGPSVSSITASGSSQTIAEAQSGYGMGGYSFAMNFSLEVPAKVTIVSQTGTGSKYSVGDEIGIIANTYTSTITYTVGSGI